MAAVERDVALDVHKHYLMVAALNAARAGSSSLRAG
jgi:hypothetical protein